MLLLTALSLALAGPAARLMYDETVETRVIVTPADEHVIYRLATHAAALDAWKDKDNCTGTDFSVTGHAHGSFTRKDSAQDAYLYEYCQLGPYRDLGLVITEHGRILTHHVFKENVSDLSALKDINRNGRSELLMTGVDSGAGGIMDGYTLLAEYSSSGQPTVLGVLPAFHDECGAHDSRANYEARGYVTPGPRPTFELQKVFRPCPSATGVITGSAPAPRVPVKLAPRFAPLAFTRSTLVPARDTSGVTGAYDSTASILDTDLCHTYGCTNVQHLTGPKAGPEDRVDVSQNNYFAVRYALTGGGTVESRWSNEAGGPASNDYLELRLPLSTDRSRLVRVVQAFLHSSLGDQLAAPLSPAKILSACRAQQDAIYASNPDGYGLFALCEKASSQYVVKILVGE
jgi:hypothetical protein